MAQLSSTTSAMRVSSVIAIKAVTLPRSILRRTRSRRSTIPAVIAGQIIFRLKAAVIEPLTPVGRVTMYLLQLNSDARLVRRKELIGLGAYPCEHEL